MLNLAATSSICKLEKQWRKRKEVKANWNVKLQIYIANADSTADSPLPAADGRSALDSDDSILVCGQAQNIEHCSKVLYSLNRTTFNLHPDDHYHADDNYTQCGLEAT